MTRLSKENSQLREQILNSVTDDKIDGFNFLELKTVLENLHILDFFVKHRGDFAFGFRPDPDVDKRPFRELMTRGLVVDRGSRRVFLTDSGRVFLNKFEAFQMAHQLEASSGIDKAGQ